MCGGSERGAYGAPAAACVVPAAALGAPEASQRTAPAAGGRATDTFDGGRLLETRRLLALDFARQQLVGPAAGDAFAANFRRAVSEEGARGPASRPTVRQR